MRVTVFEIQPGPSGFELDMGRMHCIIDIEDGKGKFHFLNSSRERLIRSLFGTPFVRFVAGARTPNGMWLDALETHPAWSVEAVETIVRHELYGFNLGGVIEYDSEGDSKSGK